MLYPLQVLPQTMQPQSVLRLCTTLLLAATILCCTLQDSLAAETGGWRSWFNGGNQSSEATEQKNDPSTDASRETGGSDAPYSDELYTRAAEENSQERSPWLLKSPFAKVSWPEIKMPKVEFNPPWGKDKPAGDGWLSAPLSKVRSSARGAVDKTRIAWNSTVDRIKIPFRGEPAASQDVSPQIASQSRELGFWERFLGPKPGNADDPDNVVEMMAQERGGEARK